MDKTSQNKGKTSSASLEKRMAIMNNLISLEKMESSEPAQKAKVKWSIEDDENSNFFFGIFNKHRLILNMDFPNKLSLDQAQDLERSFSKEEIEEAVWGCGLDKSPGPDGFTFGFYRRFWSLVEGEVVEAVNHFFNNGFCHKGGYSSFIALISKTQGAKMVKDLRPISLIGSLYKIISKLLANLLVAVIDGIVNEVQSAFIANRQILDGPFILNEIIHWCKAKKKQAMIFKVDFEKAFDSIRWDFLDDVLKKFAVENSLVDFAANNIGCMTLNIPFSCMGVNIGGHMSRIKSWDVVINKIHSRLSKWNMKILSIGGRLTLLKYVLGSAPNYYMSLFKAPIHVINKLEAIRSHFFNGVDPNVQKMTFVKWDNVLASKEKGGSSLLSRTIKAFHGEDGKIGYHINSSFPSNWIDIMRVLPSLYNKGIDLLGDIKKKVGNGENTLFWQEPWKGDAPFKNVFPRLYALESDKRITVAEKMTHHILGTSFRRNPRGGIEQVQMDVIMLDLSSYEDWWLWLSSLRLSSKLKMLLECVFYTTWCAAGKGHGFKSSFGGLLQFAPMPRQMPRAHSGACHVAVALIAHYVQVAANDCTRLQRWQVKHGKEMAIAIRKNLPDLRHLELIGDTLSDIVLKAILDSFRHLELLDLCDCLNIDLKGDMMKRCSQHIKYLKVFTNSVEQYDYENDIRFGLTIEPRLHIPDEESYDGSSDDDDEFYDDDDEDDDDDDDDDDDECYIEDDYDDDVDDDYNDDGGDNDFSNL
nr:RNA-directed DNA polymerase, eukaryota, reverse transcriptase zinc-binding domain protein [Tanacetum cinerariifolium]